MLFVSAANLTPTPILLLICLFDTVYSSPNLHISTSFIPECPVPINPPPLLGLEAWGISRAEHLSLLLLELQSCGGLGRAWAPAQPQLRAASPGPAHTARAAGHSLIPSLQLGAHHLGLSSTAALRDNPSLGKQVKMHEEGPSFQRKCWSFNEQVALKNYVNLFPISSRFRKAFNPWGIFASCPRVGFCTIRMQLQRTRVAFLRAQHGVSHSRAWIWLQPGPFLSWGSRAGGGRKDDNPPNYKL